VYLLRKSKDILIPAAGAIFVAWVFVLVLTVPPNDPREEMLNRARQGNAATHVENWAASPGSEQTE
jgi:hypothetical protein